MLLCEKYTALVYVLQVIDTIGKTISRIFIDLVDNLYLSFWIDVCYLTFLFFFVNSFPSISGFSFKLVVCYLTFFFQPFPSSLGLNSDVISYIYNYWMKKIVLPKYFIVLEHWYWFIQGFNFYQGLPVRPYFPTILIYLQHFSRILPTRSGHVLSLLHYVPKVSLDMSMEP